MSSIKQRPKSTRKGVPVVKTTVHLPEDLWRKAKIRALEERVDLRDLIIEGLNSVLERKNRGK